MFQNGRVNSGIFAHLPREITTDDNITALESMFFLPGGYKETTDKWNMIIHYSEMHTVVEIGYRGIVIQK